MLLNTVCLPVRKGQTGEEVLLARKKVGFGAGKVVGVGGTVEPGETIQAATVREVREELDLRIRQKDLLPAARLSFNFPARPEWDRTVFVYLIHRWEGQPQPSREVDPFWLPINQLPVGEMWADSGIWLPRVLAGERLVGHFTFQDDNETLDRYELKPDKDFLWPQLKDLPYFRALLRAVEASQYQDLELPAPVLDLGSGDGHFASVAFDRPLDVGLDPWWEPLDESRQYQGVYQALVQADGADMPFPTGHFASAVSNSVLEHIPQIDAVLTDTARVLRPGAPFIFCCPNDGYQRELSIPRLLRAIGLKRLAARYTDWFMQMSRTHHADPPEVWQERLARAGFKLERFWHYFPPAALWMLEWGHFLGAPTLLVRRLFGRWILAPTKWNLWLTERLVRRYAGTEPRPDGTYTFYIARRK